MWWWWGARMGVSVYICGPEWNIGYHSPHFGICQWTWSSSLWLAAGRGSGDLPVSTSPILRWHLGTAAPSIFTWVLGLYSGLHASMWTILPNQLVLFWTIYTLNPRRNKTLLLRPPCRAVFFESVKAGFQRQDKQISQQVLTWGDCFCQPCSTSGPVHAGRQTHSTTPEDCAQSPHFPPPHTLWNSYENLQNAENAVWGKLLKQSSSLLQFTWSSSFSGHDGPCLPLQWPRRWAQEDREFEASMDYYWRWHLQTEKNWGRVGPFRASLGT